jgi:hypothetical protein
MKAATVHEIKQELSHLSPPKLVDICLRLAKFKKENKELLGFLLFESNDEAGYVEKIKNEMAVQFSDINQSNIYYTKKTLRKILRFTNKYIRYIGSRSAETELLIHFCKLIKDSDIPVQKSVMLQNIYQGQQKKIAKIIGSLHEDLQHDYLQQLKAI